MLYWTIMGTLLAGIMGVSIYFYFLYKGQFDDPEDVKYQLFRESDLQDKG